MEAKSISCVVLTNDSAPDEKLIVSRSGRGLHLDMHFSRIVASITLNKRDEDQLKQLLTGGTIRAKADQKRP